ncbi:MAG TPA: autotransporter domain-containing protein [Kiritimatiellia bacterium]|nr:autotransporter domain-containing protein [Kiritimatiellia bacterium]
MKKKDHQLLLLLLLAAGLLFVSPVVFAETVEISSAQTSMQNLETLSGGATPKTALVTSTGSVSISSGTDPAIWGSAAGWAVTVSSGRTVSGVTAGINFNDVKDASGNDLAGTVVNYGSVTGNGSSNYIFGVNSGNTSSITNHSGATISGTTSGSYGIGVFTGSGAAVTNSGTISGTASAASYGVYSNGNIAVTNNAAAVISATSATNNSTAVRGGSSTTVDNSGAISATSSAGYGSYGVYTGTGSTVTNRSGGTISASSYGNTSYGVYTGSGSTVTNYSGGTISASSGGDYAYGIRGAATVTNNGNITVNGASYAHGIYLATGGTVTNGGNIIVTASNGPTNGIAAVNGTVTNTGSITVNGTNLATFGLNMTGSTGSSVTNSGGITVTASGSSGSAYGVYVSSGTVANQSGGTISATGTASAYGVSMGTGAVTNASGAAITSSGTGVQMTGASTLNNYGTVSGVIGISATGGSAVVRNYSGGIITGTGGVALSLAGGNNTVLIQENSTINGSIEAGGSGNTLEFNGPGSYNSNITGTWALTKSGSGTLVLSGVNAYTGGTTVSAGILQGNTTSLQGNIVNNAQVTFDQASGGTYAGVMSGSGSLLKTGAGVLTLTGYNTYSGTTTVNAGALAVNGSISSAVTVNSGGALMGSGTINGDVSNSGMIAPGNSIGTLTINGNYTQNAGSIYQVEANAAGQSDKLVVNGTATLNGGTVSVLAESGAYNTSTTFTILTAGSVTGSFSSVTSNLAFLTPSLNYDANDVYLILTRNSTGFTDVALTRNQYSVAGGLDRISSAVSGDMSTVMIGLLGLSDAGARSAYDQTGGLTHVALAEASTFAFQQYLTVLSDRLRGFGQGSPAFAGLTMLAALDNTASDASRISASGQGFWMKAHGNTGSRNGNDISSKYGYLTGGMVLGYDRQIGQKGSAGVSAGYTAADVSMDGLDDSARVSVYQAAVYGGYQGAPWYVNGVLAYGYNRYDTTRRIIFGGIDRSADATYTGHTVSGYAEAGYNLDVKTIRIIPLASLAAGYLKRNGFTESGAGALNLDVDQEESRSFASSLGVRVKKDFTTVYGAVTPEASLRWQHEFLDADYSIDAAFSGYASSSFLVQTDAAARDSAVVALGVAWAIRDSLGLAANYTATISGDRSQHAATIGLKYMW